MAGRKQRTTPLLEVKTGEWVGQIAGECSVHLGQVVQPGPPLQSVEFSYILLPVILTSQGGIAWPGIATIFAPTPVKPVYSQAGSVFVNPEAISLALSLNVTREQFSDLIDLLERKRFKRFRFNVQNAGAETNNWVVTNWGMATTPP